MFSGIDFYRIITVYISDSPFFSTFHKNADSDHRIRSNLIDDLATDFHFLFRSSSVFMFLSNRSSLSPEILYPTFVFFSKLFKASLKVAFFTEILTNSSYRQILYCKQPISLPMRRLGNRIFKRYIFRSNVISLFCACNAKGNIHNTNQIEIHCLT